jgi:hypothetical protein
VVNCTGIFYTERTGHNDTKVSEKMANVNSKDLTLRCLSLKRHTHLHTQSKVT